MDKTVIRVLFEWSSNVKDRNKERFDMKLYDKMPERQ